MDRTEHEPVTQRWSQVQARRYEVGAGAQLPPFDLVRTLQLFDIILQKRNHPYLNHRKVQCQYLDYDYIYLQHHNNASQVNLAHGDTISFL